MRQKSAIEGERGREPQLHLQISCIWHQHNGQIQSFPLIRTHHSLSKSIGNTSHPIDAISNPFWASLQHGDEGTEEEVWQGVRRERKCKY